MSTIGEYFRGVRVAGLDEGVGAADIVQSMQATPADSTLELPTGPAGHIGETGPPAAPFRWEGDIADQAALSALGGTLGPAQAGKAWRVVTTNGLAYWNGTGFDTFPDAFGAHGPTGTPNTLTVGSVTTGPAGSDLQITVTGTPPAQAVNLVVPRGRQGQKGPAGPPGPIRAASDFDASVTMAAGMVPLWNAPASKWTPVPDPSWRGPWTIVEGARYDGGAGFVADISASSTIPNTIASLPIPAQNVAWRPFVTGGAMLRCTSNKPAERMVLQAIISGPGTIVGYGDGHGHNVFRHCTLVPHLRTNAVTPGGSVGVIAAGVAATIVLQIQATTNAPPYDYIRDYSHLAVWAVPVSGAPA
ncbi:hypothetical protein [Nocardia acidivorans]|uniref:hypothetical protein n=1 Tax=Nocardia acidivorans TaxID=404580 RepID=UPI000834AE95|nr:hypothetical protein [Nocardia acidivorans]